MLVEVSQDRQVNLLGVVARREKGNLHQPGFDGLNQAEVGHHPLEKRVGVITRSRQIERRGTEVVNGADFETLRYANESTEPDSGTAIFFVSVLAFRLLVVLARQIAVMRLVVDDKQARARTEI